MNLNFIFVICNFLVFFFVLVLSQNIVLKLKYFFAGLKCPSLPGLTHWVNPGLLGLSFKPYFGKVGNTGE